MRIVVCIKQILDPEMPFSAFKVDREGKRVVPPPGMPPVLSPFDESALEAALRIKDKHGASVVALSMGRGLARPVLRKALAAGADELVLLEDPLFESLDSFAAAAILASAIRKLGHVDIVFTGRQAADWDCGIVGCAIAEDLNVPCITVAGRVEITEGRAIVERVIPDGFEIVEAPFPCVMTADSAMGELRQVTLPGLSAAQRKPLRVWRQDDLNLVPSPPRCRLLELYIPQRQTVCQIIEGPTPGRAAETLADRLHEESLL